MGSLSATDAAARFADLRKSSVGECGDAPGSYVFFPSVTCVALILVGVATGKLNDVCCFYSA